MFGYRAYFVGRRMFACVTDEGVCLRLGSHLSEKTIASGAASPFRPHGRPMRGWVEIGVERGDTWLEARDVFLRALTFARALQKEAGQ